MPPPPTHLSRRPQRRALPTAGLWGVLLGVAAAGSAEGATAGSAEGAAGRIFRCQGSAGEILYTQFCPPAQRLAERHQADASFVPFTPLSAEEHAALRKLQQSLDHERAAQQRAAATRAHQQAEARALAAQRCRDAATALEGLAKRRRKGYTARQQDRLDAEERQWSRVRRENC